MDKTPLPPSLTGEGLKQIEEWECTHQSNVLRRVLAEVARLQAIALRAHQLDQCLRESGMSLEHNSIYLVVDALRKELDALPLIREHDAAVNFILHGHGNPPKRKDERR